MITTENYLGSSLSGNDGDANRVLTLANSNKTVSDGFQVYVDGLLQTLTSDYTITHNDSGTTIVFVGYTYNDTPITVNYYTLAVDVPTASYSNSFLGSTMTGLDGDTNRVATLSNVSITIAEGFEVYIEGLLKVLNTDYTITHNSSGSTITCLIPVYNTDSFVVNFYTTLTPSASTAGTLPLNQRFIQKNICALGDTCTVTEVVVTIGTDEYRTKSEVTTDHTNIPCYVHVLSYEDEIVKQGDAKAGDLKFWFDASYESYFSPSGNNKVRISWNLDDYEVNNIMPFKAVGNTLMLIEVHVKQI